MPLENLCCTFGRQLTVNTNTFFIDDTTLVQFGRLGTHTTSFRVNLHQLWPQPSMISIRVLNVMPLFKAACAVISEPSGCDACLHKITGSLFGLSIIYLPLSPILIDCWLHR